MPICKPLSAYLISLPNTPKTAACSPLLVMREGEEFGLTNYEQSLFDSVAQEHVNIIGTTIEYWPNAVSNGKSYLGVTDPLYNEPAKRAFLGPYIIKAYVSYLDIAPTPGMEGWSSSVDSTAYITRAEIEKYGLPAPGETDIIRVWNNPYWNQAVTAGFEIPGAGTYFSVTDCREDGMLFDTPSFMGFTLTLRRTTQQTPERKITNNL